MIWRVKRRLDEDAGGAHIGNMGADEDEATGAIVSAKRTKSSRASQPPDRKETSDAEH